MQSVYAGSEDAYENFIVRIVIAISMQKLDTQYAGLADSYYLAALPFLEGTVRAKNIGTLQSLQLVALYSMTTPTRTAAYWIVGLATKLCQELRITDEATISYDETGGLLDPLRIDMRRRLFWICLSTELGLAHSLGRPSAFAMKHSQPNVEPFLAVEDSYITPSGVVMGSKPSTRKQSAMHFMRMRLLQLEIRRTLYMNKRDAPLDDLDPWFSQMEGKLDKWLNGGPDESEGSEVMKTW